MTGREQFEQTSTERLAKRIRDILGPYNDDTESLQNLISKLVLEREEYFDRIGRLEQAARATPQVTEGMALVPVEPTEEMLEAAVYHAMRETDDDSYRAIGLIRCVWADMLAAAKDSQCQS